MVSNLTQVRGTKTGRKKATELNDLGDRWSPAKQALMIAETGPTWVVTQPEFILFFKAVTQ